jgi:hypothetical protein
MDPIRHELTNYVRFREVLLTEFPDIDDETLQDSLEGLTDLKEMTLTLVRSHLEDRTLADALNLRIGQMQERMSRLESRIERKRVLVGSVMSEAGYNKLTAPDFTVSLRPGHTPLIVTDPALLPEAYLKPQAPLVNRQKLRVALESGERVAGATLGNAPLTLTVRVK